MKGGIDPHNFITKILFAKHSIHQQLEIMTGGLVTVQINASRRLQHAAHGAQTERHIDEIGGQT